MILLVENHLGNVDQKSDILINFYSKSFYPKLCIRLLSK